MYTVNESEKTGSKKLPTQMSREQSVIDYFDKADLAWSANKFLLFNFS